MTRHLLIASLLLLSACAEGDVRNTLGLNRSTPDEFKVVSRPPLSVPPDFALAPPMPGEESRAGPSAADEARKLLLRDDSSTGMEDLTSLRAPSLSVDTAVDPVVASELESAAESKFLSRVGTGVADPKIREMLYEENTQAPPVVDDKVSPLERWLGVADTEPVVDAKAEAERIRENKDEGKPVNEGEVKTVDPSKGSVLDRLFAD